MYYDLTVPSLYVQFCSFFDAFLFFLFFFYEIVVQTTSNLIALVRRCVITTILMIHISCPTSSTKIVLSLALTLILRFIRKVLENFRILGSKYFLELLLFFDTLSIISLI